MTTNDELWKGIIEDLPNAFIKRFFKDAEHLIDFTQPIVFLDKELSQIMPESADMPRRVDKLLQVTLKGGEKQLILIHAEVQGYWHADFPEREFIYYYRLYDRFKMKIATLVIFTDSNKGYKPAVYHTEFFGTEVTYKYRVCKIMELDPKELAASNNLFDSVLLTTYWAIQQKRKEVTEEDLVVLRLDLIRRLLAKKVAKPLITNLLIFLKQYIRFEKPNISAIFEQNYDELLKINRPMGVIEIVMKQKLEEGMSLGAEKERSQAEKEKYESTKKTIAHMRNKGLTLDMIADFLLLSTDQVMAFFKDLDNDLPNSK